MLALFVGSCGNTIKGLSGDSGEAKHHGTCLVVGEGNIKEQGVVGDPYFTTAE